MKGEILQFPCRICTRCINSHCVPSSVLPTPAPVTCQLRQRLPVDMCRFGWAKGKGIKPSFMWAMCSGITWHFESSTYSSADGQQLKSGIWTCCCAFKLQTHPTLKRDRVSCFNGITCLLSFPTFPGFPLETFVPFSFLSSEMLGEHLL